MRIWVGSGGDGCDGALMAADQATVPALDHGVTVGDGVFETLKVVRGVPFALTRHLRRLRRSAAGLGLPDPDWQRLADIVRLTIDENGAALGDLARLRITYTAGPGPLGSDRGSAEPTVVVAVSPAAPWPPVTSVATVPWPRNERGALVGLKTTSYAENVVALADAHRRGASEALLANTRGELCEGTGSNVFVVVGDRVLTPPLASGCLAGITRELVLEWTGAQEADLPMSVLATADEVFITSSTRDVHPVGRVDDRELAAPGPATAAAAAQFAARSAADADP